MSNAKPSYFELLKHPKWQEKRLRIMERAGFSCENCGDTGTTLNVHHKYYERGLSPWEYPDQSLVCLCEPCHKSADSMRVELYREVGLLSPDQLLELTGFARGLQMSAWPETRCEVSEYHSIVGMVRAFLTLSADQYRHCVDHIVLECGTDVSGHDLFAICECEATAKRARAEWKARLGHNNPEAESGATQ